MNQHPPDAARPVAGECDGCGSRFPLMGGKPQRCTKCGGAVRPVSMIPPSRESVPVPVSPESLDLELAPAGTSLAASGPARRSATPPEKAANLPKGARLGRIELVKELGRGGMGVVYLGREAELRRTVAVKVLLAADDDQLRQRFLREARMVSKLRHPNIVAVHEFGEHEGKAYFSMDFIEGGSLEGQIKKRAFDLRGFMQLVATVARALGYAHSEGLVHRDVKPQNILVANDGTPFLTDFGLAREVQSNTRLTMSGAVMGTPSYMSPEQAQGGAGLDHRTDVYSLGAVLYEGLTGRPPFDGRDLLALLAAIVNEDPAPPSQAVPGLPADVETICLKALQKQPDRRYQTGGEMAEDIERWLRGESIAARRSGALEKGVTWLKRRPAAAAAGAAGLAALLVVGVVMRNSSEGRRRLIEEQQAENARREARLRDMEAEAERSRVASEERVRELEALLAKAGTAEDAEKIRRELATLRGPATSEWDALQERLSVLTTPPKYDFAAAIAALEAWAPMTGPDRERRDARLGTLREAARRRYEAVSKEAAGHEAAGRRSEAAAIWATLERIGIPELAKEAKAATARLAAPVEEAPGGLAPAVAWTRAAVAGRLRARDVEGARGIVEGARAAIPAPEADLLAWAVDAAGRFQAGLRAALAEPKDLTVLTFDGETPVAVTGWSEKGLRVTKASGSLGLIALDDVRPAELARVAAAGGATDDAVAIFWAFRESARDGAGGRAANEATARKVAGGASGARLAELLDAIRAAEAQEAETPPEAAGRPFTVDPVTAGNGQRWSYEWSAPEELRDWVAVPGPGEGAAWGASVADGRLQLANAALGFVALPEVPASIAVNLSTAGPAASFRVMLAGYVLEVRAGTELFLRAPDGRDLGTAPLGSPQPGQPFTVDLRLQDKSVAASVGGRTPLTAERGPEPAIGMTGVAAAPDTTLDVSRIEITGRVDRTVAERMLAWRNFRFDLEARPGTLPPSDLPPSRWQRSPESAWTADGRGLRGQASGGAATAAFDVPAAARVRFQYRVQSGRSLRLRLAEDAEWALPMDRPGEWRRVEGVVAGGYAFLRVDGVLAVRGGGGAVGRAGVTVADGDVTVRDLRVQALGDPSDAVIPAPPWYDPRPAGAARVRPPTPEGWIELFDQRTLANFAKKSGVSVSVEEAAILVNATDLVTTKSWKSVEVEIDFSLDAQGRVSTGLRGSWFARDDVAAGQHRVQMRAMGDKAEAFVDGRLLAGVTWNPSASGSVKIKIEGTQGRITSVRVRAIQEPETQPERPPDRSPDKPPVNPPPDKPGPAKPPPHKPPPPGPGPKPR